MEDTTQPTTPTAEQDAGTPAPPTERETQLDSQLKTVSKERDKLKGQVGTLTSERDRLKSQVGTLTSERDEARGQREALQAEKDASQPTAAESAAAETEAGEYAETKAIMRRNGLAKAWVLPSGEVCFQESHARHVAGDGFDSLTLISAE